jgi:hypothetical protein
MTIYHILGIISTVVKEPTKEGSLFGKAGIGSKSSLIRKILPLVGLHLVRIALPYIGLPLTPGELMIHQFVTCCSLFSRERVQST